MKRKEKLAKVKKVNKVVKLDKKDIKKLQRQQNEERRTKKKSELKAKISSFKFTKTHLIVLISIALVIALCCALNNYHILGLVINKNITSKDATVIETMYTDNIVLGYKDSILVFEKGTLSTFNYRGSVIWSKKLEEIYTPKICTAGDYIQVTNVDTGYIYVLEGQYEVCRIKIEGEILSTSINSDGTSVVEYSTSGLKTVLGVYSKKGREQYLVKLSSNTLSSYCLKGNVLAYAYADISGISVVTKVDIIELNRLDEENYKFNTIVEKNNELVYKMYWEGKRLNILLNDSVIVYNYSKGSVDDHLITNINPINIDICNGNLAFISRNVTSSSYELNVTDFNLKQKGTVDVLEPPKYYIYQDGLVYVCYLKQMDIYNKWGNKVKSYTSDTVITKPVIYNNGKCVAMYVSNKIITFKI